MKRTCKFFVMTFIFVLAILAVFTFSQPVHAQDELPPTEPVPVVDPAAVGSDPVPVEVPPEPEVALLTEAGEPLAVGSPDAAALPADVDPWFKVGTTTYTFIVADCDPGPAVVACPQPLQAAVDYIQAHGTVPSDGLIHVDTGTLPNQVVTVDGTQPYMNSLKGIVGHVNPATFTPDVNLTFTDGTSGSFVHVYSKATGFILSGFNIWGDSNYMGFGYYGLVRMDSITGAIVLQDLTLRNYTDSETNGITLSYINGLVTLKNVNSHLNHGGGAYIDNTQGTAGVIVSNSNFDNNTGDSPAYQVGGLHILTKGPVTITGISASNNAGFPGLWIEGGTTVTIKNAYVSHNTVERGISIEGASGAVTLSNVNADGNSATGIYVRNKGAITMTSVTANGNIPTGFGADLDNTSSTSTVGVTITNGTFSGNYETGLQVYTKGNITLTNVSAANNTAVGLAYGAYLYNLTGTGSVKITNLPSTDDAMQPGFDSNHERGINIFTRSTVTLTNVNMRFNDEDGIYVWHDYNKGVTLNNCRADLNGGNGILIATDGPIVINGGHANSNTGWGVSAHNEVISDPLHPPAPMPITISNFTANYNLEYGFYIRSRGAIKLTNVTAEHTTGALAAAIWLNNSYSPTQMVTLSKVTSRYNNNDGIRIITNGAVILSSIVADYNANLGVVIDQQNGLTTFPTATITTGSFSHNTNNSGLVIYGRGTITLKDITASYNGWTGAWIENRSGNISVLASSTGGNSFSFNGAHDGLDISTQGAVTVNNVTAQNNATGVFIYFTPDYINSFPAGNVTINGALCKLNGTGIYAYSKGTISVTNATVNLNTGNGIRLDGRGDVTGAKTVTLSRINALGNDGHGVWVDTYGAITVNTISAFNNGVTLGDEAIHLNNTYGAFLTPKGITILGGYGTSNVSQNLGDGLYLLTKGNVSITKVIANENDGNGININNYQAGLGKGMVIISTTTANGNYCNGIRIDETNNAVTLNGITTVGNGMGVGCSGVYVSSSHNHNLTVTNSFFTGNDYAGITATIGTGIFTITSSYYFGNDEGFWGVPDLQIFH